MRFSLLILLLLASRLVFSQENSNHAALQSHTDQDRSFYTLWAGGTAYTNHNDQFAGTESYYEQLGGKRNPTGVLELPGLYFVRDARTLIGFLPSLYAEDYSSNYLEASSVALMRYNFDLSYWRYFGGDTAQIGRGWWSRVDFGHSYITEYRQNGDFTDNHYHNGPNLKASLGYGFAMPGYGFVDFALGAFGVSAGGVVAEGLDVSVGFLL